MTFASFTSPAANSAPATISVLPMLESEDKALDQVLPTKVARDHIAQLVEPLRQQSFAGMLSQSPVMQQIFGVVERVAKSSSTVLILGESGTGKELIAQAIHKHSGRSGKIVAVNCGAIPEEILESELFGHEKGAFTGAVANKMGRFQLAEGGTIFLDEIGEMSPKLQVKLLRFLQERKIDPVGGTRSIEVDVRVVAATNKDLRTEVKEGRFREDLFYRLNVVPVTLPPLRARGAADVRLLAQHFLERGSIQMGRMMRFSEGALQSLAAYAWPGNIRELENLVERLSVLASSSTIEVGMLPDYIVGDGTIHVSVSTSVTGTAAAVEIPVDGCDLSAWVEAYENTLIAQALRRTGGNKMAAAKLLRMNRTTLVEKLKKKRLVVEEIADGTAANFRPSFE